MHICYLCNEYPPLPHGGVGSVTYTLAHAVARAGHEVSVVGIDSMLCENYFHKCSTLNIRPSRLELCLELS